MVDTSPLDRYTLPRVPVVTEWAPFPVLDVAALADLEALADDLPALVAALAGPADVAALEALGDGWPVTGGPLSLTSETGSV